MTYSVKITKTLQSHGSAHSHCLAKRFPFYFSVSPVLFPPTFVQSQFANHCVQITVVTDLLALYTEPTSWH